VPQATNSHRNGRHSYSAIRAAFGSDGDTRFGLLAVLATVGAGRPSGAASPAWGWLTGRADDGYYQEELLPAGQSASIDQRSRVAQGSWSAAVIRNGLILRLSPSGQGVGGSWAHLQMLYWRLDAPGREAQLPVHGKPAAPDRRLSPDLSWW
jgi:hypothetical protein